MVPQMTSDRQYFDFFSFFEIAHTSDVAQKEAPSAENEKQIIDKHRYL